MKSICDEKENNKLLLSKEATLEKRGLLDGTSSIVTTVILFLMIILSLFIERIDRYNSLFRQYVLIEIVAVLAVTIILALRKNSIKLVKLDWFALAFWTGFTLYTLVSDILVDKQYRFAETAAFIVLVLLGFFWNKTTEKGRFIKDFDRAVQWFLIALMFLSILFPAESLLEGRFNGPIKNPSVFALYLCSIWAILLGSLENQMNERKNHAKRMLTYAEMLVTLVLMVLSQSLTPLIALVCVTFLWFFRIVRNQKGTRFAVFLFLIIGAASVLLFGTLIVFVRQADVESNSRIIQKLQSADISTLLSGRDYYWRRYLREMNLLGHSKKPFLWDHRILPHNALIGMMYWYGVPSVVPYIITMTMAIEKSYRFADTSVSYAPVPFYSIVSFVIMSMADNVEQPFVWLPWIACYLMMAPILIMPVEEIEALKKANTDICAKESEQV